jgi:Protein of unknown function (DUF1318)
MHRLLLLAALLVAPLAACNPHVVIEQPKPLEININFTGHLYLVIDDARSNVEEITGEKPTNTVRPEDIGLPAGSTTGGAAPPLEHRHLASKRGSSLFFVSHVARSDARPARPSLYPISMEDDLKKAMAARNKDIRALWDSKTVGESHTGLLVPKGTLTTDQQKLVDAENKDRTALYATEAKSKSQSTGKTVTPDDVALAYYLAELGDAKPGNWYEVKKANSNDWEWKQWGQ